MGYLPKFYLKVTRKKAIVAANGHTAAVLTKVKDEVERRECKLHVSHCSQQHSGALCVQILLGGGVGKRLSDLFLADIVVAVAVFFFQVVLIS